MYIYIYIYRIAGNFHGTKVSQMAPRMKICGCWPESRNRTARTPNSRMLGQLRNLRNVHSAKVSHYTVCTYVCVHVCMWIYIYSTTAIHTYSFTLLLKEPVPHIYPHMSTHQITKAQCFPITNKHQQCI